MFKSLYFERLLFFASDTCSMAAVRMLMLSLVLAWTSSLAVAEATCAAQSTSSKRDHSGSCARFASDAALIQVAAVSSKCFQPQEASCFWYNGLSKKCCSAIADDNHSFARFCAECQGSANADVASDVSALCSAPTAEVGLAQLAQQRRGDGVEVLPTWLVRSLKFGIWMGSAQQQQQQQVAVAAVCRQEAGDCPFDLTAHAGVVFKQVNTQCCQRLQVLLGSSDIESDAAEFCEACAESTNQDVRSVITTLCE